MEDILRVASDKLGVQEIPGPNDNPEIVNFAKESGFDWVDDDETAWCSFFMNWVAHKTGYKRSKSGLARSWLNVGRVVTSPEPGDVVVYWRESRTSYKGHVGIFLGFSQDSSRIYTLGGNQGNSVSISAYPSDQLLGFRRLLKDEAVTLPNKTLQRGDKGAAVVSLQDALKLAGFNPGTSDGDFGPKTEAAVKMLQSTNSELEIDGVFNRKTKNHLLDLINN